MGFAHLSSASHTDIGCKRPRNEDSILALPEYGIFCVADGMGGAKGGEMASKALTEALRKTFVQRNDREAPLELTRARIMQAVRNAGRSIQKEASKRGFHGAGTTVVALAFDARDPAKAAAFHAGDSRLYLFRNNTLRQITTDHSFAVAVGYADPSILPAMFRNLVTRAIGLDDYTELEETPCEIKPQDLLLLCSDGLTNMLPDTQISTILTEHSQKNLDVRAKTLIEQANQAGGMDNVSVVLVQAGSSVLSTQRKQA